MAEEPNQVPQSGQTGTQLDGAPSTNTSLRLFLAVLLVIVGTLAAYGAVLAHWVDAVLLDTGTFMEAVEPIVRDDNVRSEAADTISDTVIEVIDIRSLADSILPGVALPAIDQLAEGFETLVRDSVDTAVRTDTFANLWLGEMRRWHIKLVGAAHGAGEESVLDDAVVRVTLGPYIDLLTEQAESPIVRRIITRLVPDSVRQMRVTVFDAGPIADRIELMRALVRARPYLPWAAVAALLLAFWAAPRARHVLLGAGASLAVGGVVARAVLQPEIARIETLMSTVFSASEESASAFTGVLFAPLGTWIGYLTVAGLLAAVAGAALVWVSRSARS